MRVKWSQNFLTDRNIARKIVEGLAIGTHEDVLEIGPGKGVLTEILLEQSQKVTAVEIDPSLCLYLKSKFDFKKGLSVIQSDFLDFNLEQLSPKNPPGYKVLGNLPYAVVSPILQKVFAWQGWSAAEFMVQKEVADRILALPGSKAYGILSISVQAKCLAQRLFNVSRGAFRPIPNVDSSVLKFHPLPNPFVGPAEEDVFFKVVRAAFGQRRKLMANSLASGLKIPLTKVYAALEMVGLPAKSRAETVPVSDFMRLPPLLLDDQ